MAADTSLTVIVLLFVAYLFDGLERTGLVQGTALILFWVALFYVVIRSGLNLRLPDPSLTMPQLTSLILSKLFPALRKRVDVENLFVYSALARLAAPNANSKNPAHFIVSPQDDAWSRRSARR